MIAGLTATFEPQLKRTIVRSYRLAKRLLPRRGPDGPSTLAIGRLGRFEIAHRRGTADEQVIEESQDDLFFAGVPEYQPAAGHVIVDIGAHIGTFALSASAKVGPSGQVHAIEASADSFNMLRINVALNHAENVAVHHLAIADTNGTCTLYHDNGNWGHSMVKRLSASSEQASCSTLAHFLETCGIQHCDFMKFNCEGAEFPILLATPPEVLRRTRAMLVLYHCDLWEKNTPADLVAHLERSGFQCTFRNRSEKRGWLVATR